MTADWPILSVLIWLPVVGGIATILGGEAGSRRIALAFSVLSLLLSFKLWTGFDLTTAEMQFVEFAQWIPAFNINYHLGVDGISMPLIILTKFITVLIILAGWEVIKYKPEQYMAAFLILDGVLVGVFAALDAILFYVFWEAVLIPMFIVIGIWGGPNRVYATMKFFLYTFLGSVLMLIALIYMYTQSGSFSILDFHNLPIGQTPQVLIFFAFLMAFAVKVPMWPVHTWLPDAHVEAPTGGSAVLAAILLKMGTYGFLRFTLPIAPDASAQLDWLIIALSLVAVVYIGFVAMVQADMKKLIAYSSISHMGFVTLGMFIAFGIFANAKGGDITGAALGMEGAIVQMVSHGFISAAMFFCVGVLYDRMHSRMIADYGGVIQTMPVFGAFMVLFGMANAGLPGTSGFVGEFMVILASFKANFWYAFLAAGTLILGAAYTLWMVKRVVFGAVANEHVAKLEDLNRREFLVMSLLALAVLGLGLWPGPLVEVMGPSVEKLLQHIAVSKL